MLHAPSYASAYLVYVPSLFCAMGLFSGLFAGFALLAAMRKGVITRFRVTPLSRVGMLLGRELMDVALIGFQALVITVAALVLRPAGAAAQPAARPGAAGDDGAARRLHLLRARAPGPERELLVTLVNAVAQPLSLLAGVLIPLSVAPLWVRDVALWNPFAWGTNGMRAIFAGHIASTVVWEATSS